MTVTFPCPHPECSRVFTVKKTLAGQTTNCPDCKAVGRHTKVTVPSETPPAPPISDIPDETVSSQQPEQPVITLDPEPIMVKSEVVKLVTAKSFCCNSCGSPLKIPKNSRGHVVCPSCRNECVLEGLVKNAEIAAKENINSGVSLSASPATLHKQLIKSLCDSTVIPLDVFNKAEVVREEHYCTPAYLYYCNGTASFTYEAGNVRQHKTAIDLGDKTRVETQNYMEWTQLSSSAAASATLFASGNREVASQIRKLYMIFDPNNLEDYEYLEFPSDVVTHNFNLPQAAAFNEYLKPHMEELLEKKVKDSLKGRDFRDLTMGGSNIQKDEVVRVFLGLYHVIYKYDGREYSVWMTGDGSNALSEGLPVDVHRKNVIDERRQRIASIPDGGNGPGMLWIILSAIAGIFTVGLAWILTIVLIVFKVIASNKRKALDGQRDQAKRELSEFEAQASDTGKKFKSQRKALRGIYGEVTGDPAAF